MPNHFTKTDLENIIFARAAHVRAEVYGKRGELAAASGDVCLQVMLCVYNAFFAEENRAFLGPDGAEEAALWRLFAAERRGLPPLVRAYGVPFFKRDFWAELFWLSGKETCFGKGKILVEVPAADECRLRGGATEIPGRWIRDGSGG